VSATEWDQLGSLDFLVRARKGIGTEVLIAYEVSNLVDANDVRRAAERAALIRRAGLEAEAYAGGQVATPEVAALAAELGVTLVVSAAA
jgi:hypothetical protein